MSRLAGYLEGEGCFGFYPEGGYRRLIIQVASSDKDAVSVVACIFGARVTEWNNDKRSNRKPMYMTRVSGKMAADLMMRLYPLMMSKRRKNKILECLKAYKDYITGVVPSIEAGEVEIAEGSVVQ